MIAAAALALLLTVNPALDAARGLLTHYHEDLPALDRARDLLETAAQRDPSPEVWSVLARTWFLIGEFRARSDREKIAAYERGREAGRHAVAAAPRSEEAHVWYAINSGRLAGTRGLTRAAAALPEIRDEAATILELNPDSVEGNTLAGGLAAELPKLLGGDRARAERLFRRALQVDPRRTGTRVELARLYIATRRYAEAQRELDRVIDEPAPSDLPYWTLADVPHARDLLAGIAPYTAPRESP